MTIEQTFQIAVQQHQAGRLAQAEKLYGQILAQCPNHAESLHHLGLIAHQSGRNDIAADLIKQSLALQPDNPDAYSNLALVQKAMGQLDQAIATCHQALTIRPHDAQAHHNLGIAFQDKGASHNAIAAYSKAIALNPNHLEAHNNLGSILHATGQLNQAVAVYHQAIVLHPNIPELHNNLGNAMTELGQPDEAIAAFRRALLLKPDYPQAQNNLGGALHRQGQLDEAIAAFRHAITLNPNYDKAHSNLVSSMYYSPGCDSTTIAQEQSRWNRQHAEPLKRFIQPYPNDRNPERPLRIGYVSADFRDHASANFLIPLLEHHDPQQVEVFCYAQVLRPDRFTNRMQQSAAGWRSTVGLSDTHMADLIRQDRIDILVDLKLHTTGNRLLVFARKPAPVQVTWLGYPAGTGLQTIDYRLSDPYLDPPGEDESIYTERTVRLPETFWCYDPLDYTDIPVNPLPAAINGFITFGCLNNFSKINAVNLALWVTLLQQMKNSRLLLLTDPGSHVQPAADQLCQRGIDPQRLTFIPRQSHRDYLKLFHRVDISLDTLPYNGHTTSLDSLWMGVPFITLPGRTAVGRAGVSILSNIGLPELIADSEEKYIQLAVDLAHDLLRLSNLRSTLRQRMQQSPLMDAPRFARNIQAAYRRMWHTWVKSNPHS